MVDTESAGPKVKLTPGEDASGHDQECEEKELQESDVSVLMKYHTKALSGLDDDVEAYRDLLFCLFRKYLNEDTSPEFDQVILSILAKDDDIADGGAALGPARPSPSTLFDDLSDPEFVRPKAIRTRSSFQPLAGDYERTPQRNHHYNFAHHQLKWLFESDPACVFHCFPDMMEADRLRSLWLKNAPGECPDPSMSIGLTFELLSLPPSHLSIALFSLPKPWFTTGAYYVAGAVTAHCEPEGNGNFGFCTLERTVSRDSTEAAVFCSWAKGGHRNHGHLREISKEAFLEEIVKRMAPECKKFQVHTLRQFTV